MGPGVHQHRHLRPPGARSSTTSTWLFRRLLQRRVPAAPGHGPHRCHRRGLLGKMSGASRLPQRPQGRPRPARRPRHPGVPHLRRGSAEGAEGVARRPVSARRLSARAARSRAGCRLGEYVVLGSNVRLLARADLRQRTVVHHNAYMAPGARVRGTVIGRASNRRGQRGCRGGVVSATRCSSATTPSSNLTWKVYPFKTIEDGAVVNSSIIWEEPRAARFRPDGSERLVEASMSLPSWRPRWPWPTPRAPPRAPPS